MVFGLMAFSTSAQASGQWLFAEKAPNSGLVAFLEASLGLEAETTIVVHTKIAGISVLYLCPIAETLNFRLKANGSIGSGALIDFLFCLTHLNGVISKACEPIGGGKAGVIKTTELHGLIELHELTGGVKDDVVRLLPDSGETVAIIEMSAECAIGTKVPLIGKVVLKDCENLALTHLVKHLVEIGPLTEIWAISKTAEHVATILGSMWAFLTGAHEGLKFSLDPI
jgi:hypothetical protein